MADAVAAGPRDAGPLRPVLAGSQVLRSLDAGGGVSRDAKRWCLLALAWGCSRDDPRPRPAPTDAPSASSAAPVPETPAGALPPLEVPPAKDTTAGLIKVPAPHHRAAWVSAPRGATELRPLVIYAHGAGGNAYATCQDARGILGDDAFALCPFGSDHPHWAQTFESLAAFRREVEAGLEGLARRYEGYVDVARPVLAGWSIGANLVASLAIQEPSRFPRLVLLEGGALLWNPTNARAFGRGGGQRVVFVCGRAKCRRAVASAVPVLEEANVAVKVLDVGDVGHSFRTPPSMRASELPWLVEGDPRWRALLGD